MSETDFDSRYKTGNTPWDHGMVDGNLIDVLARYDISPCKALDVGCGTGENAIWLARNGFDVVACDLAPTAIVKAEAKADAGLHIRFQAADFLSDPIPGAPFGFVFDRGCLHCMPDEASRHGFVEKAARLLAEGGWWLTLAGNADEKGREMGPPQLTAAELVSVTEPFFETISLSSGQFGSDQEQPPRAWICLMRRRMD